MFYLKLVTDSLSRNFQSRFDYDKEGDELIYYKDSASEGVPCDESQYNAYLDSFERMLKMSKRLISLFLLLAIPTLFLLFRYADTNDIELVYVKVAIICFILLPLPYIIFRYRKASDAPNTLYEDAIQRHPIRSSEDLRDSRLHKLSFIPFYAGAIFCVLAMNMYFNHESHENFGAWVLALYVGVFILLVFMIVRKYQIAIPLGIKTGNRITLKGMPSIQAGIKLKPSVWIKHSPYALALSIGMIVTFALAVSYQQFIVVFAIVSFFFSRHWVHHVEKLLSSDVCPGIIVSESPKLIAVHTDLENRGDKDFEVIKILKYKSHKLTREGDKMATVATYSGSFESEKNHWNNFYPIPATYASDDEAEYQNALNKLSDENWKKLENGLKQINKPYKTGLYEIEKGLSAS